MYFNSKLSSTQSDNFRQSAILNFSKLFISVQNYSPWPNICQIAKFGED